MTDSDELNEAREAIGDAIRGWVEVAYEGNNQFIRDCVVVVTTQNLDNDYDTFDVIPMHKGNPSYIGIGLLETGATLLKTRFMETDDD